MVKVIFVNVFLPKILTCSFHPISSYFILDLNCNMLIWLNITKCNLCNHKQKSVMAKVLYVLYASFIMKQEELKKQCDIIWLRHISIVWCFTTKLNADIHITPNSIERTKILIMIIYLHVSARSSFFFCFLIISGQTCSIYIYIYNSNKFWIKWKMCKRRA